MQRPALGPRDLSVAAHFVLVGGKYFFTCVLEVLRMWGGVTVVSFDPIYYVNVKELLFR